MVEIWQANAYGRYNHPDDKQEKPLDPTFTGWGRSGTDTNCFYNFETIKPGPVPGDGGSVQAPHINVVDLRPRHVGARLYAHLLQRRAGE